MRSERVAVLIPARDAAATLAETLDSLAAQTRPPDEVIVVDDGSRDGTAALARRHPLAPRVLAGPGRGPAAATNLGVRAASAGWIAALDADDLAPPERIEIDLHHRAMHAGRYGRFDDDLVARSLPGELLGRPIRVLAPVDEALVAIGQALQWDTNPSHPWIGDALSALRAPGFDAAEFWARARARRFDTHAAAVLEWLDRRFGLPPAVLPARPPPRRGPALWLDRAELRAMARPPRARGVPDRAALWLAEALRGGWRKPSPPFPTDLGQRLTPSAEAPRPVPPGEEFAWDIAVRPDGGRALTVTLAGPPPPRADFDLWFGGVWAARLRLRPLPWQRGARVWTATIPPGLPRGEPALLRAPRRGPEEGAAE
ncbi:MAG: glycosyltransferase [Acetobacteraceae bacterium]|nr:glycosyltransferase [Acetobacteraceae bacterium]